MVIYLVFLCLAKFKLIFNWVNLNYSVSCRHYIEGINFVFLNFAVAVWSAKSVCKCVQKSILGQMRKVKTFLFVISEILMYSEDFASELVKYHIN